MSDEFKGSIPNIKISTLDNQVFNYNCGDEHTSLYSPCSDRSPVSEKCFDCIGFNRRFAKYFRDNRKCPCGYLIDFGYFILIFHLGKANLLPNDFKITCCHCHKGEYKDIENWFTDGESW